MMKDDESTLSRKWHELAIGTAKRRMARMGHLWRSRERKRKREREKERKRERGEKGRAQSAAWCHIVFAYSQPSFSSPLQLKHRFPTAHKTANIQPFYFSDPWALEALPRELRCAGELQSHLQASCQIMLYINIYIIESYIYNIILYIFILLLYIMWNTKIPWGGLSQRWSKMVWEWSEWLASTLMASANQLAAPSFSATHSTA